jgi:anti-anti-sigma regulatory factor
MLMLRITARENPGNGVCLMLEGRLIMIVPWVEELEAVVMGTHSARGGVCLDLSGLRFVDARGLRLLHRLVGEGVILERVSPFIQELLSSGFE